MDEKFEMVDFSHFGQNEPSENRTYNLRLHGHRFNQLTQENCQNVYWTKKATYSSASEIMIWMKNLRMLSFHILDKISLEGVEPATFGIAYSY